MRETADRYCMHCGTFVYPAPGAAVPVANPSSKPRLIVWSGTDLPWHGKLAIICGFLAFVIPFSYALG